MSLFNNISEKIANLILARKQKLNQRHVEFHNMKSARHIGILFDADNNTDNKIVENFYKDLKNQAYNVGLSSANLSKLELCAKIKEQVRVYRS